MCLCSEQMESRFDILLVSGKEFFFQIFVCETNRDIERKQRSFFKRDIPIFDNVYGNSSNHSQENFINEIS